jgi:hypothetical protein
MLVYKSCPSEFAFNNVCNSGSRSASSPVFVRRLFPNLILFFVIAGIHDCREQVFRAIFERSDFLSPPFFYDVSRLEGRTIKHCDGGVSRNIAGTGAERWRMRGGEQIRQLRVCD